MLVSEKNKWKSTLFWLEKIQIVTLFGFSLEIRMFHETLKEVIFTGHSYCFQGSFIIEYSGYLLINILIGGIVSIWISIISYRNNTLKHKFRLILFTPIFQSILLVLIIFLFHYRGLGYEVFYGNKIYEYAYLLFSKITIFY